MVLLGFLIIGILLFLGVGFLIKVLHYMWYVASFTSTASSPGLGQGATSWKRARFRKVKLKPIRMTARKLQRVPDQPEPSCEDKDQKNKSKGILRNCKPAAKLQAYMYDRVKTGFFKELPVRMKPDGVPP